MERKGHWDEARLAAERVVARLTAGDSEEFRRRAAQVRADLDLVARLEDIRLGQAAVQREHFDTAQGDSAYREAFRGYGLDVEAADPAEVAESLRASPIRDPLLAGLDDWVFAKRQAGIAGWERLVMVAGQADSDPWSDGVRSALLSGDHQSLAKLARDPEVASLPPTSLLLLGWVLRKSDSLPLAVEVLRQAQQQHPDDFWINHNLGLYLMESKPVQATQAAGFYRAALVLRPHSPGVLNNLGNALAEEGQLAEAEGSLREAIRLKPDFAMAHCNLGHVLTKKRKLAEAVHECQKAIKLNPDYRDAHFNLGVALAKQGKLSEAVAEYRKALSGDPNNDAAIHYTVGTTLYRQGNTSEAIAAFGEAVRLQPDYAEAHVNLGIALKKQGKLPQAEDEYLTAIRVRPALVEAHYNLALLRQAQNKLIDAAAEYQTAIRLRPDHRGANGNLSVVLMNLGRFTEARAALEKTLKLQATEDPLQPALLRDLRNCAALETLDQKLTDLLIGNVRPASPAEAADLARLCQQPYKRLYAASARIYAEAFNADPKLADNRAAGHRYNAACAAALAGCGQGQYAAKLQDKERTRLRRQCMDWLLADLAAWTKLLDKDAEQDRAAVAQTLRHWQKDADLAGLRDKDAVAKLPEAEQAKCQKLWADVAAVLVRVKGIPQEAPPNKP